MIYASTYPTNDCFWNFAETTVPISRGGAIFLRCEYYGHKGIFFADDFDFSDLKSKQIKGIFKLEGLFFNCILDIENEKISLEDFIKIFCFLKPFSLENGYRKHDGCLRTELNKIGGKTRIILGYT